MNFEELKKSLLMIKTECEKQCDKHNYNCGGCPLAAKGYNICGIVGDVSSGDNTEKRPLHWKIVEEPRLFER